MHLKIGTRSSQLAVKQTHLAIDALARRYPSLTYEIITIRTTGDKIQDRPLYDVGGKALFLKELEEALINKRIDIAVHSLKDVPGVIADEFSLGAVLPREEAHDCLVSFKAKSITDLPNGSRVGTSSPRRIVQLKELNPTLKIFPLRGNINTRLSKLRTNKTDENCDNKFDAIVLAKAGLQRLNLWNVDYCFTIPSNQMIPAVGQGAIVIECLTARLDLLKILASITDATTSMLIDIERQFLSTLNANCRLPVAAYARLIDKEKVIKVDFMIADENFANPVFCSRTVNRDQMDARGIIDLGTEVALELKALFVNGDYN